MHPRSVLRKHRGFTLVEILIAGAVSSAVGLAVFAFMNAGVYLTAKNLSLNYTSNQMRTALDRVESVLQQGDNDPVLIDTNGATVATGPAAGVKLDRFVGGPWVVTTAAGSIPATASTLTITRSTHPQASPAIPTAGDVIRMDGTSAALRPRVSGTATANTVDSGLLRNTLTYPLAANLGTAINNTSGTLTAKVVRQVAFIIMPNGAKRELRYYPSLETTTNLNDSSRYVVVTDQIGTDPADSTPFNIITGPGKVFVNFSLRVGASTYSKALKTRQADEYNTFSRIDSLLRPKVNP